MVEILRILIKVRLFKGKRMGVWLQITYVLQHRKAFGAAHRLPRHGKRLRSAQVWHSDRAPCWNHTIHGSRFAVLIRGIIPVQQEYGDHLCVSDQKVPAHKGRMSQKISFLLLKEGSENNPQKVIYWEDVWQSKGYLWNIIPSDHGETQCDIGYTSNCSKASPVQPKLKKNQQLVVSYITMDNQHTRTNSIRHQQAVQQLLYTHTTEKEDTVVVLPNLQTPHG